MGWVRQSFTFRARDNRNQRKAFYDDASSPGSGAVVRCGVINANLPPLVNDGHNNNVLIAKEVNQALRVNRNFPEVLVIKLGYDSSRTRRI